MVREFLRHFVGKFVKFVVGLCAQQVVHCGGSTFKHATALCQSNYRVVKVGCVSIVCDGGNLSFFFIHAFDDGIVQHGCACHVRFVMGTTMFWQQIIIGRDKLLPICVRK